MGKHEKSAIKNKEKLAKNVKDSEIANMKLQLEELKADNERLRKKQFKIDQNDNLHLTTSKSSRRNSILKAKNIIDNDEDTSDSETNISNNQKVYKRNKTQKIINVSENSETDELTYKQVLKKRKHYKNKQTNKVTIVSGDSKTNNEQVLLKKHKKKINNNESDIKEVTSSQVSEVLLFLLII